MAIGRFLPVCILYFAVCGNGCFYYSRRFCKIKYLLRKITPIFYIYLRRFAQTGQTQNYTNKRKKPLQKKGTMAQSKKRQKKHEK
jgi:hypothetical protein